jgi:EAL domain-containing protein (putative c-di-GMP-specific phosphodiesterase class I)
MELLVRWNHPENGLISPDKFIKIAEKTGLVVDLDRYLLKKSLKIISKWKSSGLMRGKLSVNLVAKNLESSDFCDVLIQMIKDNGCEVNDVELEVTEGSIMKDPESAIIKLNNLKKFGFSIAIDDFGTGYSSLSYLKRFPITKLKIDRSFVMDIPEDEDDKGIVKMIIGLCEILKIDVIAEGVETKDQSLFLLDNGCKKAQGFLYSKPLSEDDMFKHLKASC